MNASTTGRPGSADRPAPRPGRDGPADTVGMETSRLVTRRALAAGVAWAVPVIAVGAPVPAMAASPLCFSGTVVASQVAMNRDKITVTNTGPGVIPAGTVVTWMLQSLSEKNANFGAREVVGVAYSNPLPSKIAEGETVTIHLTVSADVPSGGVISWAFMLTKQEFNSSVMISSTGPSCGVITGCASGRAGVFGSTCPV